MDLCFDDILAKGIPWDGSVPEGYSVIYAIHNPANGKVYFGQTTQALSARWGQHTYLARKGYKHHLANAIRANLGKLTFQPIMCFPLDLIDDAEVALIDAYGSADRALGYNNDLGGRTVKIVSDETRQKISKARTGTKASDETKRKLSIAHKGKPQSEEWKARRAEAQRAFLGTPDVAECIVDDCHAKPEARAMCMKHYHVDYAARKKASKSRAPLRV
jgi:hypothetical protein